MRINALSLKSKHYKLKLREFLDVRGLMVDISMIYRQKFTIHESIYLLLAHTNL